ncbi:MAG: sugar ABC transporter permease [Firmicutes bacterium]|jgi:arabinogalactan oligomer/maltooligosaccharide transport system permease protein|nr:sugar ABC transporter permease [Bacillota bacterium]
MQGLQTVLIHVVLICAFLFAVIPIVYILMSSLRVGNSLYSSTLIPRQFTFQHYASLFTDPRYPFLQWTKNTLKVSTMTATATVILTTMCAYVFSRFRFWGRKYGLMAFMIIQMFPGSMSMVALYVLLNLVGLLDTHVGLALIYIGGGVPFSTWLLKGYLDSIDVSLDEAALVDGATRGQIFRKITLPLARPILAAVSLFSFIGPFNDYLLARIVITSSHKNTLAVGLHSFIAGNYDQRWTQFAAGAVLVSIPILLVFFFLEKNFISGLTAGATKA